MSDSEDWPVCSGCGRSHPTRQDIINALVADNFDEEEAPQLIDYSSTEMAVIVAAIAHLSIRVPELLEKQEVFLSKIVSSLQSHPEIDFDNDEERITFVVTTSDLALQIVALRDLAIDRPDFEEMAERILDYNLAYMREATSSDS